MPITYGEAKQLLSKYAGRAGSKPGTKEVELFVKEALQYLLIQGEHGSIRKYCFSAVKGVFTVPYEIEAPVKVEIDGRIGSVWNYWFTYFSGRDDLSNCLPSNAIYEEPNVVPTVYDLPVGGARIGVLGTAEESADAHVIVQGFDTTGREVYTNHKGQKVAGEYLSVKRGELIYSQVKFGRITSVFKTRSNGYVQLLWVRPDTSQKGFLADYTPLEEHPSYRRFRIDHNSCEDIVKVSVIAKIRLKDAYADNEVIPFDNLFALNLAGQMLNKNFNDQMNEAAGKKAFLDEVVTKENQHKATQAGPMVDVFIPLSGGSIKNCI